MSNPILLENTPPKSSEFHRRAEREACQRKLIDALRTVAFLASRLANDTPGLSERTRLSQITARVDDQLRRLCTKRSKGAM